MKDEYKIEGAKAPLQLELEKEIVEQLDAMAKFMDFTVSEIVNTALKNYISRHKDFLPPKDRKNTPIASGF